MTSERDVLDPEIILDQLGPSLFSENIIFRKTLDSTNRLARELARQGAPEGSVVLAEKQTAGRGRKGRAWISPGYRNLLFSLLLRPSLPPHEVFALTMTLALAACEAVREKTGLEVLIKWPNDLYVGQKKLAGILTEFALQGKGIDYVILGIGLNVNWNPTSSQSTALRLETGRDISRNDLFVGILQRFEEYYKDVSPGRIALYYEKWNALSLIMGKDVEIEFDQETIQGKALGIDYDGALIIRDLKGREKRIRNGDVTVKWWRDDVHGNEKDPRSR